MEENLTTLKRARDKNITPMKTIGYVRGLMIQEKSHKIFLSTDDTIIVRMGYTKTTYFKPL